MSTPFSRSLCLHRVGQPLIDERRPLPPLRQGQVLLKVRACGVCRTDLHVVDGIYGFGAAAHIVAQVARWRGQDVYAFTRPGDRKAQTFALQMGAYWTGDSDTAPPVALDAAILFAPVGSLVPTALSHVRKGGTVVCGGIHMSDIPSFAYSLLWGERVVRSVANLTHRDGVEFLEIAGRIPVRTEVEVFSLAAANEALHRLRTGALTGAAVLVPGADC